MVWCGVVWYGKVFGLICLGLRVVSYGAVLFDFCIAWFCLVRLIYFFIALPVTNTSAVFLSCAKVLVWYQVFSFHLFFVWFVL